MKETALYKKLENGRVQCQTCAHGCIIASGKLGICGVRENREGILYSLVYRKAIALHVDPIEKKPLFHFHPGTRSFSMATVGCNMTCDHCQNSNISQMPRDYEQIQGQDLAPADIIQAAVSHRCRTISYTYTEPAIYLDYAYDTAVRAREKGLQNIFVTNGYFSNEALERIIPVLDGANVDLKSFNDETYRSICGARLEPVLKSIQTLKERGVWVEVTTLLIPDLNDSDDELLDIARFIHDVDPGIPWHVSRFHPTYRMTDRGPTSIDGIQRACQIGKGTGLRYVYSGNVHGEERESTFCYECGAKIIQRYGFEVAGNRLVDGRCPECNTEQDGVW